MESGAIADLIDDPDPEQYESYEKELHELNGLTIHNAPKDGGNGNEISDGGTEKGTLPLNELIEE
jgi:hypothetical protein